MQLDRAAIPPDLTHEPGPYSRRWSSKIESPADARRKKLEVRLQHGHGECRPGIVDTNVHGVRVIPGHTVLEVAGDLDPISQLITYTDRVRRTAFERGASDLLPPKRALEKAWGDGASKARFHGGGNREFTACQIQAPTLVRGAG